MRARGDGEQVGVSLAQQWPHPPRALRSSQTKSLTPVAVRLLLCPRLLRLLDPVFPLLHLGCGGARLVLGLQCPAVKDSVEDASHEGRVPDDLRVRGAASASWPGCAWTTMGGLRYAPSVPRSHDLCEPARVRQSSRTNPREPVLPAFVSVRWRKRLGGGARRSAGGRVSACIGTLTLTAGDTILSPGGRVLGSSRVLGR